MIIFHVLLQAWAFLSIIFLILWLIQVRTRDASLVDVGWAGGLGLTALYCAYFIPGEFSRRCLVAGMAFVWSTRLAWHLYTDRVRGKSEDGRYVSLRKAWAERANLNFFIFFRHRQR
jgi:steroid 5-alpha reductase family enzyme